MSINNENKQNAEVQANVRYLDQIMSGVGWGLFFIMAAVLFFAGNQGWIGSGEGWLYLAIGLGAIFIIGFLVRYLVDRTNVWKYFGGLMLGVGLAYVGAAFLFGFGAWWPLVLVPVGITCMVRGLWHRKPGSFTV